MPDYEYLIDEYKRLMHLAVLPTHTLLTMTRKFAESCLHELLIHNNAKVDDSYTIEKLRDSLKKNPNIEFPAQRDLQINTIQLFGNLSVHHKHETINCAESWQVVYPALRDFTRWLFREMFSICKEFDSFEPFKIQHFAEYGFRIDEGIFRMIDNNVKINSDELEGFKAFAGLMFEQTAPTLASTMRNLSQFFLSDVDLSPDLKKLLLECMIITSWWAPYAGFLAYASDSDLTNSSTFVQAIDEAGIADALAEMLSPTNKDLRSNLDPDERA